MKNIVEYIDEFLKKKGVEWYNKAILDVADGKFVAATDKDFSNNEMQSLKLINSEFGTAVKQILINENLFLVFDEFGSKLQKDFSNEWINHLLRQPEIQEESFKKFINKSLNTEDNIAQDLKENRKLQNVLENIDTESEKED